MPKFKIPKNIPTGLRHCPCCQGVFPPSEFNRDRQRPDGLRVYHKACDRLKAMAVVKRRQDLLAAGKRMTNPSRVTPAERHRAHTDFLTAMTETAGGRTERIATAKATRAAMIASR